MTTYTEGKWAVKHSDTVYAGHRLIADCEWTPYEVLPASPSAEDAANAARIVACVNACAGMVDPAKEIAELRSEVEWARRVALAALERPAVQS